MKCFNLSTIGVKDVFATSEHRQKLFPLVASEIEAMCCKPRGPTASYPNKACADFGNLHTRAHCCTHGAIAYIYKQLRRMCQNVQAKRIFHFACASKMAPRVHTRAVDRSHALKHEKQSRRTSVLINHETTQTHFSGGASVLNAGRAGSWPHEAWVHSS